jgi:hypothetical protein
MSPLGEDEWLTEIAPEAENLHGEVAKISAKLAAARDLREGLARILSLPINATNDQIFAAVRSRRAYVPPGDRVHDQIKALEGAMRDLAGEHTRLIRSLRAKGILE